MVNAKTKKHPSNNSKACLLLGFGCGLMGGMVLMATHKNKVINNLRTEVSGLRFENAKQKEKPKRDWAAILNTDE